MAKKRKTKVARSKMRFGKRVLRTVSQLKSAAQDISGPITQVLHEMEGKLFRAAGVIRRSRRQANSKPDSQ